MSDEQPDKENEVTPQGAVEVDEEDLDQAAGGAAFVKLPVDYPDPNRQDPSLKQSPTLKPTDANWDMKKL